MECLHLLQHGVWKCMCFAKSGKNIIFQNKTLLVMFYRHNKTFWYQFCNFKHFLKAENSEDSLASSCVEFSIGLSWDWVTVGTGYRPTYNKIPSKTNDSLFCCCVHRSVWLTYNAWNDITCLTNEKSHVL